jgi:hypothetical protein
MAINEAIRCYIDKLALAAENILDTAMYQSSFGEPPELIWHYTNLAALHGIVSEKKLRMSHIDYLNDSSEYRYGLSELRNFLENEVKLDARRSGFIRDLVQGFDSVSAAKANVFLTSFCKEGESIPHWQIYSGGGTGVSIGFDWRNLDVKPGYAVVPVIYGKERGVEFFSKLMHEAFNIYEEATTTLAPRLLSDMLIEMGMVIDAVAASIKMECFSHETEYRLLTLQYQKEVEVKFTPSGGMIKSYIEYDLMDLPHAIKKIRVGPARFQDSVVRSVEFFLNQLEIGEIPVEKFQSPYLFSG